MTRLDRSKQSSADGWMQLAARFLARRDRTVAQVEQFLRSKGALPGQIRHTLRRLSDLRCLNDHAYAQRWVEQRLLSRPMGQVRIKAELQAKGVAETVADRVIADAFREVGEEQMARRALDAKQHQGRRLTPAQSVRFLRQRGFDDETIDGIVMVARGSDEGLDS
ncbi:MAG: RecX family transcriptional regulator [Nitrospira sp.]|nr:RecX family transcriptional regulator [Nitrospira sp.]